MLADELVALLSARHPPDKAVFVSECKTGYGGARRLDAWALLKTWSPLTAIGYEVKVSRSDFLQDSKWPEYLPVCHELWFVAPPKLIDVYELPAEVGLMVAHGSRLVTKRKAVRRQPDAEKLVHLMAYVLMSRTRTVENWREANSTALPSTEYWRAWLCEKRERRNLGLSVAKRLGEEFRAEVKARREAESQRDSLLSVRQALIELGLPETDGGWGVRELARKGAEPQVDTRRLRRVLESALTLLPVST